MTLPDARMIEVMEYAVNNKLAENEGDFWEQIKFTRTALSNIRKGVQSFRINHIINACNATGVSADWILGLDNNMFRTIQKPTIQTLKEIVAEMEGKRGTVNRWENMQFAKNKVHA